MQSPPNEPFKRMRKDVYPSFAINKTKIIPDETYFPSNIFITSLRLPRRCGGVLLPLCPSSDRQHSV
jgi:hypothetical protein